MVFKPLFKHSGLCALSVTAGICSLYPDMQRCHSFYHEQFMSFMDPLPCRWLILKGCTKILNGPIQGNLQRYLAPAITTAPRDTLNALYNIGLVIIELHIKLAWRLHWAHTYRNTPFPERSKDFASSTLQQEVTTLIIT